MFLNRFVWNLVREICTLALGNSEFPGIRCSESHTLHFTRSAGGWAGRCWIFPDFLLFRPNCVTFGTQPISTWMYRLLVSFVKAGVNECINFNFHLYCPLWVELRRGDLHIMLLSSFEFSDVGSIRELGKFYNEELQNSDFSPWSTLVGMKSQDDDDNVCVCVFEHVALVGKKRTKILIGNP